VKYVVAFVFCTCVFAQSQSQPFSCPSGTEDMLNYFVMAYPARVDKNMGPGNANPVYSSVVPDYGDNTYAAKFVYDRSTELGWTDPTSFKRFNIDLPMSRRCVPVGYSGATLKIPASNTFYQSYSQCAPYLTQPLGYVVNSVSASTWVNVGNVGPTRTRYFTYKYSCDSNYANCQYKEVYSLGLGIGLFDWKYYVNKQGSFVLQQESIINQEQGGQTTPSMPCANSYE